MANHRKSIRGHPRAGEPFGDMCRIGHAHDAFVGRADSIEERRGSLQVLEIEKGRGGESILDQPARGQPHVSPEVSRAALSAEQRVSSTPAHTRLRTPRSSDNGDGDEERGATEK